ncbi:hypothetical protein ACH5A7_21740 [Streptomyces sp. NPDC018955]|uniref:hypothetical protein n=1 Tax=Streptomyces sp. NPDC018955 TaxID=3365055 RepID=UPI003799D916
MITHSDDGPEFEPDDPLAVILRPTPDHLGPPPGRFEEIRRGAARRRLVRTAVGAGLTCAVAALVVLPLRSSDLGRPVSPTVPLAPPPVSSPSVTPAPSASPEPAETRPTPSAPADGTQARPTPSAPTDGPRTRPTPLAPTDGPETPVSEVAPDPGPR